jgi:hypothetical protein
VTAVEKSLCGLILNDGTLIGGRKAKTGEIGKFGSKIGKMAHPDQNGSLSMAQIGKYSR